MRERVPPVQNSNNLHAKLAAKPPTFGALLFSFGRDGSRFRRVVLEDSARRPLTLSYDNNSQQVHHVNATVVTNVRVRMRALHRATALRCVESSSVTRIASSSKAGQSPRRGISKAVHTHQQDSKYQ